MRKVFERIYQSGQWIKGSGWGSWIENVGPYVDFLQSFLNDHNDIDTVLDIGCGDWEFSQYIDWDGRFYQGIDVVPFIIKENNRKFGNGYIEFFTGDATRMDLAPADLIIVKDVLMHWPTRSIRSFFKNAPDHKYMLVTNDCRPEYTDPNIHLGGFQNVDLTKHPYNREVDLVLEWEVPHPRNGGTNTKKTFLLRNES